MKILKDKLDSKYKYPCTVKDLRDYLKQIPKEDIEGVKSIRLSNQKSNPDGGYLHDGRIEIIYFVDKDYKKRLYGFCDEKIIKDSERFGGEIQYFNGKQFVNWNSNDLKKYIQFVLYHEIGHHVYKKRFGEIRGSSHEEKFCDDYANKYIKA